jgi:hypothetical protein
MIIIGVNMTGTTAAAARTNICWQASCKRGQQRGGGKTVDSHLRAQQCYLVRAPPTHLAEDGFSSDSARLYTDVVGSHTRDGRIIAATAWRRSPCNRWRLWWRGGGAPVLLRPRPHSPAAHCRCRRRAAAAVVVGDGRRRRCSSGGCAAAAAGAAKSSWSSDAAC